MFTSKKTIPIGIKDIIESRTTTCYQENLRRRDAEEQLSYHCDGTFVFRPNTSIPAWYYNADKILSLSLKTHLGVKHFIIIYKNETWYVGGIDKKFDSFRDMLIYYSKNGPSKTYNTTLIKSLPVYNIYEK
jgi:hypothetical protein